ncbi:hypothetical protein BDZ89DRAFT_1173776 [Hymenopellis radicata]|nr:hypothetical protein BDZ89DRAFT_1173776 [Hymenopellis radicata]
MNAFRTMLLESTSATALLADKRSNIVEEDATSTTLDEDEATSETLSATDATSDLDYPAEFRDAVPAGAVNDSSETALQSHAIPQPTSLLPSSRITATKPLADVDLVHDERFVAASAIAVHGDLDHRLEESGREAEPLARRTREGGQLDDDMEMTPQIDAFFSTSTIRFPDGLIRYKRVPSPAPHSVVNFGIGELESPTPAAGTGPRGRGKEDEEAAVVVTEEDGKQQRFGQHISRNAVASTSSGGNRRKRVREDVQEDGVQNVRNTRARHDNFCSRLLRRLTPQYLQYWQW